jgi:Fic family protein
MAHAAFKDLGMNIGLWSPSRGLARSVNEYKQLLSRADQARQGSSTDGRGALSEQGLVDFCDYYLDTCIDQVEFMQGLFDVGNLTRRIEKYCHDEHERSNLSMDAFLLLREAIYRGEFERGEVSQIIHGKSAVTARRVLKALLDRGLLESDTPRGAVRLAISTHVLGAWFPNLYPEAVLRA